MRLYDLFSSVAQALAVNSAIYSWAQQNFGRGLSVFADLSSAALPGREEMPYAVVHTPVAEKHEGRSEQRFGMAIDLALDKDALSANVATNLAEPAGVKLICELLELVVAAVRGARPENALLGYSISADTLGALPEVRAYLDMDFTVFTTLGEDPLA